MSGEVNGDAHKSGGRKRLSEAKERLFGGGHSVGEHRDGMRARDRGEELNRGSVPGKGHRLDTDARLDPV